MHYDTIIVGGGPAGLSAALVLGRCRRSVLVVDAGKPRNYAAHHLHNYLSRDGINPRELLEHGRRELAGYGVQFRSGTVTSATCRKNGFAVEIDGKRGDSARTLLLATGVVDELPNLPNLRELYGRGVHHCPYCDGWEYRDRPVAAYGLGRPGLGLALSLLTWTSNVTVTTDGKKLSKGDRAKAKLFNIRVREETIDRLEPSPEQASGEGVLERIVFQSGPPLPIAALFFNTDQMQRSGLPSRLGCALNPDGGVVRDKRQRTGVDGLYLAGDASCDVQFVIVAAAEGAKAGVAINSDLQERDRNKIAGPKGDRRK
jgi:thioredoxin reductase